MKTFYYFSLDFLNVIKLDIFNLNTNQLFKINININYIYTTAIHNFANFNLTVKSFNLVKDNSLPTV